MNIFSRFKRWVLSDRNPDGYTLDAVEMSPNKVQWLVYKGQVFEGRFDSEQEAKACIKELVTYPVIRNTWYYDKTGSLITWAD